MVTIFQVALNVMGALETFVKLIVQPVVVTAEKLKSTFSKLPVPLTTLAAYTAGAAVKVVAKLIGPVIEAPAVRLIPAKVIGVILYRNCAPVEF